MIIWPTPSPSTAHVVYVWPLRLNLNFLFYIWKILKILKSEIIKKEQMYSKSTLIEAAHIEG